MGYKIVIKKFEDFLRRRGLRLTGQRKLIALSFFKYKGHISTEELYRQAQKNAPGIGYATVYRTLKLLAEAGLASGRNFRGGFIRFEPLATADHHDHLICVQCNKIVEFINDRIEHLQKAVAEEHGFRVTDHTLELYGTCDDCQK